MKDGEYRELPLADIIGPKFLLRPVLKTTSAYEELKDSIRQNGLHTPVGVRPAEARAPGKFEIIYGNWRYNAHLDLRLPTIRTIVRIGLSDLDVLAIQIQENAVRTETSEQDYRRQIKQIMSMVPGVTKGQIAVMVNKPPQWVARQMGLMTLDEATIRLVDRGEIPLGSAYKLAKIQPASTRTPELIEFARTLPTKEFQAIADGIIKRRQEEVRQGRLDFHFNDLPFKPVAHQRNIKEVQAAIGNHAIAAEQIATANAKTPFEIWDAALKYTIYLDRHSVDEARRKSEMSTREDLKKLYGERPDDDLID